jgi:hypothetical protein
MYIRTLIALDSEMLQSWPVLAGQGIHVHQALHSCAFRYSTSSHMSESESSFLS